jgi:hypothetical protein
MWYRVSGTIFAKRPGTRTIFAKRPGTRRRQDGGGQGGKEEEEEEEEDLVVITKLQPYNQLSIIIWRSFVSVRIVPKGWGGGQIG